MDLIKAGAPLHILSLCPGLPLAERQAIHELLCHLSTEQTVNILRTGYGDTGCAQATMYVDGVYSWILLATEVYRGSHAEAADVKYGLTNIKLVDNNPQVFIESLYSECAIHNQMCAQGQRIDDDELANIMFRAIPTLTESAYWGACHAQLIQLIPAGKSAPESWQCSAIRSGSMQCITE